MFLCLQAPKEPRDPEAPLARAREQVTAALEEHGIQQLFLGGPQGCKRLTERPDGPHVEVLATEVSKLRTKQDVIVVCGAAAGRSDPGIWAYRTLMHDGDMMQSSVVGLAAKLAVYGQSIGDEYEEVTVMASQLGLKESELHENAQVPGVIILNGQQTLYSHVEGRPMSYDAWYARQRPSIAHDLYKIDEEHNRVPGHNPPFRHFATFFDHVLPGMVRDDVRLYVVCMAGSAKDVVDHFDHTISSDPVIGLASQLKAIALIEPEWDPENLFHASLKSFLAMHGRSWVMSSQPKGDLVGMPHEKSARGFGVPKPTFSNWPTPEMEPKEDAKIKDLAQELEVEDNKDLVFENAFNAAENENDKDLVFENASDAAEDAGDTVQNTNREPNDDDTLTVWGSDSDGNLSSDSDDAYQTHTEETVACPTFSAGDCNGQEDTVWPTVMDSVLQFFRDQKQEAEKSKSTRKARGNQSLFQEHSDFQ